jgi:hypothetical protein
LFPEGWVISSVIAKLCARELTRSRCADISSNGFCMTRERRVRAAGMASMVHEIDGRPDAPPGAHRV